MAQTEGDLYAALSDETHSFALELVNPGDVAAAAKAMNAAARGMARVRHPEEPTEQFANMISRVYETEDSAWFYVDAKDRYAFPVQSKLLVRAAIRATDKPELADAVLKWTDRQPPPAPFTGRDLPRETPIHLPPGFELPGGAKVARTRLSGYEAKWRWAMWDLHGEGNFEAMAETYRAALADAGWELGELETRALGDENANTALRWTVANAVAGGHVSTMWNSRAWTEEWFAQIEFTPTESGWKPYVDEEVPWPEPVPPREPELPLIESFDPATVFIAGVLVI